MWSRTTASVTSRSSLSRSVILAGFHMGFNRALHPQCVASWTVISKQYLLSESILSWFWSIILTVSLASSCSWSTSFRLCTSWIRDALDRSIDASLLGMGEVALALSSWLSALEGPELPFDQTWNSLFGVFLLPLWLFLLGMLAFKLMISNSQQYSNWIQLNTHIYTSAMAHKRK